MDLTKLYEEHRSFIKNCAKKTARRYGCGNMLEDLVSAGTITFLEQINRYDEEQGASVTTFLHPHIIGAMRREAEKNFSPFSLTRREFEQIRGNGTLALAWGISLDEPVDEGGDRLYDSIPAPQTLVEQQIYIQICLEYLQSAFETLSFKEREILGGFFGVYDYKEQTLAEIGEEFQMKESAALKAKDKAFKKLRGLCLDGELGYWRSIQTAIGGFRRDCVIGCGDSERYAIPDCCEEVE